MMLNILFALLISVGFVRSFHRAQWSHFNRMRTNLNLHDVDPKRLLVSGILGLSIGGTTLTLPTIVTPQSAYAAVVTDTTLKSTPLFDEVWGIVNENFVDINYNNHDWKEIKKEYSAKLEQGADEHALLKKMLGLLGDKYTRLLEKDVFESLWKYDAIGVGLLFQSDPGKTMVVAGPPISNSAGEKAGLKKGDFVYAINGKSTSGMTAMNLLDMMSNDESDVVTVEYGRKGADGNVQIDHKEVTLKRSKQKAENPISYTAQRLDDGKLAGYIKFSDFNSESVPGLRAALDALNSQGVDEILLDLRGNTGGGFQFALNVGGMFMDDKEMATAVGKGGEKNVFRTSYPDGAIYKKPLLIMIDGLSASASEVLTGGLHDNCRAVTVGANSFGKGKIQAVFGLTNGEGLVMTVAQYVTPRGTIIQSKGLTPDIPSKGALNPYLGIAMGALAKPDLASVEFDKAAEILKSCVPPAASAVFLSPSAPAQM